MGRLVWFDGPCPECKGTGQVRRWLFFRHRCPRCDGWGLSGYAMMMDDEPDARSAEFGRQLRRKRECLRLTMRQVADGTGLSVVQVSDIERGRGADATQEEMDRISEFIARAEEVHAQ